MRIKIFESAINYPLCLSSQLLSNSGSDPVPLDKMREATGKYFLELEKRQGLIQNWNDFRVLDDPDIRKFFLTLDADGRPLPIYNKVDDIPTDFSTLHRTLE